MTQNFRAPNKGIKPTSFPLLLQTGGLALALAPQRSDMSKVKRKLTPAQKKAKRASKAERQRKYEWIFISGKQVRVKRPPTVEGIPVDQFIEENADPIPLHQNELWELMPTEESLFDPEASAGSEITEDDKEEGGIPF